VTKEAAPVQITDGIRRLTQGVTNFYLIEQSGKFTLVDAGTPGDWAFFQRSLTSAGAQLSDLEAGGGFGLPQSVDATFSRLVDSLDATFTRWADREQAS
jgi:hypothetical protein